MKKSVLLIAIVIAALLVGSGVAAAFGGGSAVAKLNQAGNDRFYQDAYDEAWGMYQSAQMENPEMAELYYNAANALYKQGLYEEALTQMGLALQFAADPALAEQVFFNLGNSSYNMQDMETAVSSYIEALLRDPNDADAKYNLELALVQQQQQEQEQEQQDQEQQDQEQQDQEQQDQQEQDQSENGDEQDQSDTGDGDQDQSEDGDQGEDQQDQQGDQGDQSQDGQSSDPQDGDQSEDGQPSDPTDQQGEDGFTPAPGERMTRAQAARLLAALASDSQTLQEALGQVLMIPNGRPPVQDW